MGNYDDTSGLIRQLTIERDDARLLAEEWQRSASQQARKFVETEEALVRKHEEAWAWCSVAFERQKQLAHLQEGLRILMTESTEPHVKALALRLLREEPDDGRDAT